MGMNGENQINQINQQLIVGQKYKLSQDCEIRACGDRRSIYRHFDEVGEGHITQYNEGDTDNWVIDVFHGEEFTVISKPTNNSIYLKTTRTGTGYTLTGLSPQFFDHIKEKSKLKEIGGFLWE